MLSIASLFEDAIDFSMARNTQNLQNIFTRIDTASLNAKTVLSAPKAQKLDSLINVMRQAGQNNNYTAAALASVESYRILVSSLNTGSLTVPVEVSYLDYAGFKLMILSSSPRHSVSEMDKVIADAATDWNAIKTNVSNKALANTVATTLNGLQKALKSRNRETLNFGAKVLLELVDLLEHDFEKPKAGA